MRYFGSSISAGEANDMKNELKGRIHSASEVRRLERNTVWAVTCLDKNNRERFLGSYPSWGEAEQARLEEFSHRRQTEVMVYDAALLVPRG